MNKRLKNVMAAAALMVVLGSSSAYASADNAQSANVQIKVNSQVLTVKGYQEAGKEVMIPLRDVADALGIKVVWNNKTQTAELTKNQLWTAVKVGEDRYNSNKMLVILGAAPELRSGKTYVPASFADKILHMQVTTEGNSVEIKQEEAVTSVESQGVISQINDKGDYQSIRINGLGVEGTVLNVGSSTKYISADGKELSLKDLKLGMTIKVKHSMAMTMSLPPQTAAFEITVLDKEQVKEFIGTSGTVEDVTTETDGSLKILIKGEGMTEQSPKEVALIVSKNASITALDGAVLEPAKLVKGATVMAVYDSMLTRSLPPIGQAAKIVLVRSE